MTHYPTKSVSHTSLQAGETAPPDEATPRRKLRDHLKHTSSLLLASLVASALVAAPGCLTASDDTQDSEVNLSSANATQEAYLRANPEGLHGFRDVPLGNIGMPLILLKLFEDVVPDKFSSQWAAELGLLPTEAKDEFASQKNTLGLPYGFGWATNTGLTVAALTCGACHTGGVMVDGKLRYVMGAPNTRFNPAALREKFYEVVNDPKFTLENVKAALGRKSRGWLYPNDPARETYESLLIGFAYDKVHHGVLDAEAKLRAGSLTNAYKNDKDLLINGVPGQVDIFGVGGASLTPTAFFEPRNASKLTKFLSTAPAYADYPSVWNSNAKARPRGQWDGFITEPLLRNLASAVGNIGEPSAVDFKNAQVVTKFLGGLPSAAYPFVDDTPSGTLVSTGRTIYERSCSSCHDSRGTVYPAGDVGTDLTRAVGVTPGMRLALRDAIEASCKDKSLPECSKASADRSVLGASGGYLAGPLDGIWARAPYLHNGSVPTLRQLLIEKERPATFFRGNYNYDRTGVGFEWSSGTARYDTKRLGQSNQGHSGALFNGPYDFANDEASTQALLAYLKTL